MAKKTAAKPSGKQTPAGSSTQPNAITIRGSAEWKGWLEAYAAKLRTKPTLLIDAALAERAARDGFTEPPPRMPS